MEAEARKGTPEDATLLVLKTEEGARGEGSNGPLKAETLFPRAQKECSPANALILGPLASRTFR